MPYQQVNGTPGLIAIGRDMVPDAAIDIVRAVFEGGASSFEVALSTGSAIEQLSQIAEAFEHHCVGAGTVTDVSIAEQALDAGARFLVTPNTDPDVIAFANEHDVVILAGAMTPTEIHTAWSHGATAIKLFPALPMGPAYLKALRGPYPTIPFVPTGGVASDNAAEFLSSGAAGLAVGGWLTNNRTPAICRERAQRLAEILKASATLVRTKDAGSH